MTRTEFPGGTTVAAARRRAANLFREAGLDTPDLDARVLIGHALGLDHTALARAADQVLDDAGAQRIADVTARRLAREPVSRIVGRREFWGLDLEVSPAVLTPRPDTETIVEAALAALDAGARTRPITIADLGTGTGAILLALLSERPHAHGVGTDVSPDALTVARRNAERHALTARAAFVCCSYGSALAGGFDLVVTNPPYVRRAEIDDLAPEVRDHDPRLALDGGVDGLDAYRAIAADALRLLAPGGVLVTELGYDQASAVRDLFETTGGVCGARVHHDLSSVARALVAYRQT